nr:uncharacterized protein LOC109774127 [Aegilops tauschii subsp. strangulata]
MACNAPDPGHQYLVDHAESDVDDPDLGAASMEEHDAAGGGGEGVGGSAGGGGDVRDWPDDDEGGNKQCHIPEAGRTGVGSSTTPTAAAGVPKHRADARLFGSRPSKKARATVAATKRQEAAKAAAIRKGPKQRPMVSAAPLSLSRAPSALVIGAAGGPEDARRMDPAAALREVTERNAREVELVRDAAARLEAEAADAARAKANAAAKAQADAAAKEQSDATAKAQEEDAARDKASKATGMQQRSRQWWRARRRLEEPRPTRRPWRVEGPTPSSWRRKCFRVRRMLARGNWPEVPEVPPSSGELVLNRVPVRQCPARAVSAPRLTAVGTASSSAPNTEAASAALLDWESGTSSGTLNGAVKGILERFNAHSATLLKSREELRGMQAAVRDYHNSRVAAYNAQHQALAKRTAELNQSREAAAQLRVRVGELETELHTKEQERSQAAKECDRLAKELADQAEQHQAEVCS